MPHSAVIDDVAKRMGCCRRQIERAFKAFEASPARELRAIRTELAAACLIDAGSGKKTERIIAQRVGLTDDRALRRVMAARWAIAPSQLREAAALQRHLCWSESAAERTLRPDRPYERGRDLYRDHIRKLLSDALAEAPVEVRRLVEGELCFPLPKQAAERAHALAVERVWRQWSERLRELELAA